MVALEFDPGLPGGIICPQLAKHQLGLLQKEQGDVSGDNVHTFMLHLLRKCVQTQRMM